MNYPAGMLTVTSPSAKEITANPGAAQVWAIYATEKKGKVTLGVMSLKGSGGVAGSGMSPS